MHWMSAQFDVCMSLESRDMSLHITSLQNFVRIIKETIGTIVSVAESTYNKQSSQFGLVMHAILVFVFRRAEEIIFFCFKAPKMFNQNHYV